MRSCSRPRIREPCRVAAADPRHLGAEIGVVAVLHTWGQNLHHHPHVHCVVPSGGLSLEPATVKAGDQRWIACRPGFFLPVRVLVTPVQAAIPRARCRTPSTPASFASSAISPAWPTLPPFCAPTRLELKRNRMGRLRQGPVILGGPEQVLAYLGRYTHRVAIANSRLVSLDQGKVSFRPSGRYRRT